MKGQKRAIQVLEPCRLSTMFLNASLDIVWIQPSPSGLVVEWLKDPNLKITYSHTTLIISRTPGAQNKRLVVMAAINQINELPKRITCERRHMIEIELIR